MRIFRKRKEPAGGGTREGNGRNMFKAHHIHV
jgi:hypothetical protein